MVKCASVKKKGSTLQCTANAIFGHTLCGNHARSKNVTLWKDTLENDVRIIKCQAVARGWFVRHHLRLAGPGVLRRKGLANDDELVSGDEASRQHPFEYFAFVENDKTWWFSFGTIWTWSLKSVEPSNPYTRTPLTRDVRKRLREYWAFRLHHSISVPNEPEDPEERIRCRWVMLCQTFADYGFTDVSLGQMMQLTKRSHIAMWKFLREDSPVSLSWARHMLKSEIINTNTITYIINSVRFLMRVVTIEKDPYITIFNVMSAIYRC
jgi:hypothetical protein